MPADSPKPYMWMLAGSFFFACMGTLANLAGQYFPWQIVAIVRCAIPFALIIAWALMAGVTLLYFRPAILWMRSIAGSVSLVSTFFALSKLPASEVFTITNMFPLWIALLSWPMLGQTPSLGTWLSVICGVAGVFVIFPPTFLMHAPTVEEWPVLVALMASVSTAFAMVGLNRLRQYDTRAVVVHFSFTALAFATGSLFVFDRSTPSSEPNAWAGLMVLGAGLAATVGQMFLTKAFTAGPAAKVAVVNLAQIPFTIAFQILLFDYRLDFQKILGMALVLGPTAYLMIQHQFKKRPD